MDLLIEDDHPLKPAIDRWSKRLPDGVHLEFHYSPASLLWPCHMTVNLIAATEDDANGGTQSFLDVVADGRKSLIRSRHDAKIERDFLSQTTWWRAYLRLAIWNEAGLIETAPPPAFPGDFGVLRCAADPDDVARWHGSRGS